MKLSVIRRAMVCLIRLMGFGFSAIALSTSLTRMRPASPAPSSRRMSTFSRTASRLAAGAILIRTVAARLEVRRHIFLDDAATGGRSPG